MNRCWRLHTGWQVKALSLACCLGMAFIIIGGVYVIPVQADIAPQPILPGGSNIKPEGETPVQMTAEKVVMTVRQGTDAENAAFKLVLGDEGHPWLPSPYFPFVYLAVVDVEADFTMVNPTGDKVSMTVWFPLASTLEEARWEDHIGEAVPRIENFQVAVDGKPVDFTVSELPNPQGGDKPPLPWASFPVTFPAGEEVLVRVNYGFLPDPSVTDLVGMTLSYIFQTGAGWAGPIGKAELEVNLPYPASEETIGAMPEGGQVEGQQVRWTWENLEPGPQDDFSILLLRPECWDWLQAAQTNIKNYPDFGQGWLILAHIYERLSQGVIERGLVIPYFGETYQRLGVQAAQEAARLSPEDIGPHYELALLYASALEQNPSPEELQPVLDEIEMMYKLNPEEAQALEPNVNDILYYVLYNDATATADAATWAAEPEYNDATGTADAISGACWEAFGVFCDEATATADEATRAAATPAQEATETPEPSVTPMPQPAVTAPTTATGVGQGIAIGIIVIVLVIVAYLVGRRRSGA